MRTRQTEDARGTRRRRGRAGGRVAVVAVAAAAAVWAAAAGAQQQGRSEARPAAERAQPDWMKEPPKKFLSFDEWVAWMRIPRPVPKSSIIRIDEHHAYPHPAVPWKMEIVREEGDQVWLTFPPPEDPESPLHSLWTRFQDEEAEVRLRAENEPRRKLLDYFAEIEPLPSVDVVRLERREGELPESGLWQVSFDVADMDEDGRLDLVLPPQRKGDGRPRIYLGDGKGGFTLWREVTWGNVPFGYGDVEAVDLDGDGHLDLVFAVHLKRQFLCLGDGKGNFTRCSMLPTPDPRLFSRAVTSGDFNGDGRPDLAFIAEIDYDLGTTDKLETPTVWVLENRGKALMQVHTEKLPSRVMADRIRAADVDGDGDDDLILASNTNGWRYPLLLNEGGWRWRVPRPEEVLSAAFHFDVVPVPSRGLPGRHDLLAAFQQYATVPDLSGKGKPEVQTRTGLARYVLRPDGSGFRSEFTVLGDVRQRPVWRLAAGDIDGDGVTDVAVANRGGGVRLLLGRAGGWVEERSPELEAAPVGKPFDLRLVDLDGDGRDDLVLMGARSEGGGPGGVQVWMSRPARRGGA